MKQCFKEINFSDKRGNMLCDADSIIYEYQQQGFDLTLRQLYYQFVARGMIENSERSYNNLGNLINDGRLAGALDWSAIVDRTRRPNISYAEPSMENCLAQLPNLIANYLWKGQETYVEVWVEKEALAGVVQKACSAWRVPWFCCRGYTSQTAMYGAAGRLQRKLDSGEHEFAVIIYLGDHDPSGLDMSRDIQDRMDMFGAYVQVERVALNWDQITEYNPPPNPTKLTDSRAHKYVVQHGYESWELDSLPPDVMVSIIDNGIRNYVDADLFNGQLVDEHEKERVLGLFGTHSVEILDYVRRNY
jgi:hypothetical protein